MCMSQYGSAVYIRMAMGGSASGNFSFSLQGCQGGKKLDDNITQGTKYRQTLFSRIVHGLLHLFEKAKLTNHGIN